MAYRYRILAPSDGDVLNVDDWILNNAELADEFNGYLDRDNLPADGVTVGRTSAGTFYALHSDAYNTSSIVTIDSETVEWVSDDGTDSIGTLSIDCPTDCLLKCYWSGWFEIIYSADKGCVRTRITVDGYVVAESGWQAIGGDGSGNGRTGSSPYICGAIPVTAGPHTITVQVQAGIPGVATDEEYDSDTSYSITANQWELTARELVVEECRR
jgi:hypothetical protein